MSFLEIDKQLASAARTFFDNYTAQSPKIAQINENLLRLIVELDKSTTTGKQIRDNVAMLGMLGKAIEAATAQAKANSDSSAKLAKSLNIITAGLVVVGILQIVVLFWHH
jgi:ABC-type transporter Mla subunit MlaD